MKTQPAAKGKLAGDIDGPSRTNRSKAQTVLKIPDKAPVTLLDLPDHALSQIFNDAFGPPNLSGLSSPFRDVGSHFEKAAICRRLFPIAKAALARALTLEVVVDSTRANRFIALQQHAFLRSPFMRSAACRRCVRDLTITYVQHVGNETIKAAAAETSLLISYFPLLDNLNLQVGTMEAEEATLFVRELDFPEESNFKISLTIQLYPMAAVETAITPTASVFEIDDVLQLRYLSSALYSLDITRRGINNMNDGDEFDGPGLHIRLCGLTFWRTLIYGLVLSKAVVPHEIGLALVALKLHITGDLALTQAVNKHSTSEAEHASFGLEILQMAPYLQYLELDLQSMEPTFWKRLARSIPSSVRKLRLIGRENRWARENIQFPTDDRAEAPTVMKISAFRCLAHVRLERLETNWIFFSGSSSALDRPLFPATIESLEFANVGPFPFLRFKSWLQDDVKRREELPALTSIKLHFIDPSVFQLQTVADMVRICDGYTPTRLHLDISSNLAAEFNGSVYTSSSDGESD